MKKEDDKLVTDLFVSHRGLVFKTAMGVLFDTHYSENALIDTFTDIIRRIERIKKYRFEQTTSHLVKLAGNRATDIYRKLKHIRDYTYDQSDDLTILYDPESLEDKTLRKFAENAIIEAVNNLPKKYNEVIRYQLADDLSLKEVAKCIGASYPTTKKRAERARALLYHCLVTKYGDGGNANA